jgi:cytochrome c5
MLSFMKRLLVVSAIASASFIYACGGGANKPESGSESSNETPSSAGTDATSGNPSYDPERGTGKFTHVDIPDKLDAAKATGGEKVYDVKCSSCHKLTEEKLVGPGWKGVTSRHKPEWIMNFVTNTDEMITKDPKAQAQLELCMVRMPNQNLSDDDARNVYEFMRKNDGVK